GARPAYDGPRGGGYGGGAAAPGQRPAAPGGYQRPPSSAPGSSYGFPRPPSSAPGSSYGQQRPTGPGGPGGPGIAPVVPPKEGEDRARRKPHRVVEFTPGGGSEEDRRKAAGAAAKKKTNFAPAPVVSEDGESPMRLKSSRRGKKHRGGVEQREEIKPVGKRKIRIDEHIRLSDLAHQMGIKSQAIIKALFSMGVMATINQALDMDTATLLASEFGHEVENVSFDEQEFLVVGEPDTAEDLKPRPPVVTIMGHVDHGKTSLLDAIRMTSIASGEAGGITQHIGAYHVSTSRGEVVFLDTPGHEAFTTMRARGAQVTDIVVLVVAADDGVMDQTREAVNHAKAAKVPIVVAVNKIDKEGANPDRVKRELAEFDLVPEEWGGTTIFANVSAKQRIGLDELLEMIVLQAEVLELKANPAKPARGHIVEAKLDKGRGPLGTVLIQDGTLKNGDAFVCGTVHGKVRAMFNDQGRKIKQAGPAIPVEIQGFDVVPEAGDEFVVVADDKVARKIAESRASKQREKDLVGKSKVTLESFLLSKPADEAKILNLVLKADVQGSLEAITEAVNKLSTEEVKIQVVHGATGGLTESDILLASASQAIIIGFNVRPTAKVKDMADSEHVEIRFYDIIYKLVGEIKDAMSGMLTPDIQEVYLGQAEVRETFSVPKVGMVAGCGVVDGKLTRSAKVRLLRDGVVIYTGALNSLRRFKDDAKEVAKGYECGVGLENFNDIKIGDVIEAFETKEVARTID
ncbi:MAG: translation initiation factor IF-2, partial [Humidesulfovibrio sp.]|nr:translation initiation factor IF-2 [Humidesulfovibrio sp.]